MIKIKNMLRSMHSTFLTNYVNIFKIKSLKVRVLSGLLLPFGHELIIILINGTNDMYARTKTSIFFWYRKEKGYRFSVNQLHMSEI